MDSSCTFMNIFKVGFRAIYRTVAVTINNLYCIPTYVVWCVLLHPLYIWNPDWYWVFEGQFFQWLLTMVAYWSYSAGYNIVETGDNIDSLVNEETLVMANHQSTSDVPLLMHAFSSRTQLLQRLNWIMDAVFQFTNFGVVSTIHGDFFINAGRDRRDASLRDLEEYLKSKFLPRKRKWLVLFPEGGFLRKRKEASKRYAAKMNLPNLEYVTLPRFGAIQTIINTLAPPNHNENVETNTSADVSTQENDGRLKYIVDMTIAYPRGDALDLGAIITGSVPPCKVHMHYKIYNISEIPQNQDELQSWLYNLYIEKNTMLKRYYDTGVWDPEFDLLEPTNKSIRADDPAEIGSGDTRPQLDNEKTAGLTDDGCTKPSVSPLEIAKERSFDSELLTEKMDNLTPEDCQRINESMTDDEMWLKTNSTTIHLDMLRIILLHVMFITSTLVHCTAFGIAYNYYFGGSA